MKSALGFADGPQDRLAAMLSPCVACDEWHVEEGDAVQLVPARSSTAHKT